VFVVFDWNGAESGEVIECGHVVLCTGTFLRGEIHIGRDTHPAGRLSDPSAPSALSQSLTNAGFKLGRLQTGTPARLEKGSINWEGLGRQEGDQKPRRFGFLREDEPLPCEVSGVRRVYVCAADGKEIGQTNSVLSDTHDPRDARVH
jgi:tRNA U34 5-carboxymethylaminomethyl modifying enzyme MnmG/GidA